MNKLTNLFFGFLLAFLFLLILLMTSTPVENASGVTDAQFSTLQRSGTTVADQPTTKWLAYFFGLGIIGIFSFCIFIGASKKEEGLRKKINNVLSLGTLFYIAIYTLLVFSWWDYTVTNSMDYFMGLPKPTAWMVFALMFIPIFFTFFYIRKFDEWIISAEEMEKFNGIVAKRREREEQA